jgi:hypothetical protein
MTGGSSVTGREMARGLASWRWAIVVVYLEDQRGAQWSSELGDASISCSKASTTSFTTPTGQSLLQSPLRGRRR